MEPIHWFIFIGRTLVDGRSSDGRTFKEPTPTPEEWAKGFTTALNMSGQTFEIRR